MLVIIVVCFVGSCVVGLMFDIVGFEFLLFVKLLIYRKIEFILLFVCISYKWKGCLKMCYKVLGIGYIE